MAPKFNTFEEYYDVIEQHLTAEDWSSAEKVAKLLSCRDEHASHRFLQIPDVDGEFPDRHAMEWAFDDIIVLHLRVLYLMSTHQYETAYTTQATIVQVFNKEILQKEKESNWFMPILYKLCSDLRLLAKAADSRPSRGSHRRAEQASFYEDAANPIMESYRICVAESRVATETTKKIAILNLTNHLFRIYFKINRLNLLKPLIRAIDHAGDELYRNFSMADKVTYRYYLGRKAMFDSNLQLAEECLSYAFRNCPNEYTRNKRMILAYLIPVKMFLGHMPTQELLRKYNLLEFSPIAESVKEGNLRKLNDALEEHQHFFIECGIFLMLEKLKIITYRTLFKQVVGILGTHQIKLDAFLVALRFLGTEMDADELACILANLIAQKKIKGYISHQHQTLVVSKAEPFPPLSGVTGR